jgi:hypothetical protein
MIAPNATQSQNPRNSFPPWRFPKGIINAADVQLEGASSSCERWEWRCAGLVVLAVVAEIVIAWVHPLYDSPLNRWGATLTDAAIALGIVGEVIFSRLDARIQTELRRRSNEQLASAQADAAKANKATEELRQRNLELEQAVAPRFLEQGRSSIALKPFAGAKVLLSSVPDFEPRRFIRQLSAMFGMAEWQWAFQLPDENVMDGIEVEFVAGIRRDSNDPAKKDFHFNRSVVDAALALIVELKKQRFEVRMRRLAPHFQDSGQRSAPLDTIVIRVGMKPSTYFFDQQFPEVKALREKIESEFKQPLIPPFSR